MGLRGGFHDHTPKKPRGGRLGRPESRLPQEDRIEKDLKRRARAQAKRQPGSGNQPGKPGDFEFHAPESLLLDGKTTTEKRSIVITMGQLRKITREADGLRKTGGLVVGFESMAPPVERDWALVPLSLLLKLIDAAGWDLEARE